MVNYTCYFHVVHGGELYLLFSCCVWWWIILVVFMLCMVVNSTCYFHVVHGGELYLLFPCCVWWWIILVVFMLCMVVNYNCYFHVVYGGELYLLFSCCVWWWIILVVVNINCYGHAHWSVISPSTFILCHLYWNLVREIKRFRIIIILHTTIETEHLCKSWKCQEKPTPSRASCLTFC